MDSKRFTIFENTDWSASEEVALLTAIEEFGYGNWINISRRMTTRSPEECQDHYNTFYINNPSEFLPILPNTNVILPHIVTPYNFRLKNIEEPPRLIPNVTNLAGYSAARSDFEYPYDNNAENIMTSLCESYGKLREKDEIIDNMACAVFKAFNNRLRERSHRYKIMRDYGLISARKTAISSYLENVLSRHSCEKFLAYAQLMRPVDFDYIMHSLRRHSELKNYLNRLRHMREKGIRTIYGIQLYNKLKQRRDDFYTDIQNYFDQPDITLNKNFEMTNYNTIPTITNRRSIAAPLDIIGLPGYDHLTDDEKKLCSKVRLVPDSFFELKRILMAECDKMNGLRLQDARKAIRIDVNKTRKLYDFLVEQGHITKPVET